MNLSRAGQRKAERRRARERKRAEDLAEAGRMGEEFGLGAVDEVIRQWRDRSGLITLADYLVTGVLVWGIGGTFFFVLPPGPGVDKVGFGVFIAGLIALAIPLYVLGERFKMVRYRYLLYSGGVVQLVRGEPEPRVLRWADVESVTITTEDEDGDLGTDVVSCVLSGPGTEITAGPGSDIGAETPGLDVAAAAHRRLAPRLVPPLIRAFESGEPVTCGPLSIDQEGVNLPPGIRCAWSEITTVEVKNASGDTSAPITRIDFSAAGTNRNHQVYLSGIPNVIFFAHLIATAATRHGVEVGGYRSL